MNFLQGNIILNIFYFFPSSQRNLVESNFIDNYLVNIMATGIDVIYGIYNLFKSWLSLASKSIITCLSNIDLNVVCFILNIRDLSSLLKKIACLAKHRVHVKDLEYF